MSRYTTEQARHLYNMAFALELSGRELLRDAEVVARECNGIGADWMPEIMRQACTELNPVMEIPAAIHDLRYSRGTTRADRQFADDEFLRNCIDVINHEYAWWNPLRYVFLRRAKRYHGYLRAFGGIAFGARKETK
jgi:hypothetical protein